MSDVKDLVAAIITGKDYSEKFNVVMATKVSDLISKEKERVASSMFSSSQTQTNES